MTDLNERLNILLTSGQINEDSVELATKIIDYFKQKLAIQLTEENGAMLITHIVMANERLKKQQPVEPISPMLATQLQAEEEYINATTITTDLIKFFSTDFVLSEFDYIRMHVISCLKGAKC
ncbi:MAG: PRD domain-containing protein [Mycoplasmatales bacterium]